MEEVHNEMKVIIDYCFNEFLKMSDYIKGELEGDQKKFLKFILQIFEQKINTSSSLELVAKEKFPFP